MATATFLARAKARAEVKTITPANVNIGNTFSYTINGKTITVTATAATVANVTALAVAALEASEDPEFSEITWTDETTHVEATSEAGVPFTLTSAAAGGTATNITATTTAATGPTFWDDLNNWDTGAVPGNGDTANVDLSLGSITDGFAQSAVTLAALNIFSAAPTQNTLGRPKINTGGYTEYRTRGLAIGATATKVDAESPLIVLNYGSVQNATEVRRTGTNTDQNVPAVLLIGTSGSNTIDVVSGSVGLAYYDGESYSAASLTAGPTAEVQTGAGATIADTVSSGTIGFRGTGTNFQTAGGVASIYGTPGFSVLIAEAGQTFAYFGGTIADVTIGGAGGVLDASLDGTARTFTSCSFDRGGVLIDPDETVTVTNGYDREPGVTGLVAAA